VSWIGAVIVLEITLLSFGFHLRKYLERGQTESANVKDKVTV